MSKKKNDDVIEKSGAEAPSAPVSVVVVGPAAHDPLAHQSVAGSPRLTLGTWMAAKRLRPVQTAAFAAWARLHAPAEMTAAEWSAAHEKFQQTPIK